QRTVRAERWRGAFRFARVHVVQALRSWRSLARSPLPAPQGKKRSPPNSIRASPCTRALRATPLRIQSAHPPPPLIPPPPAPPAPRPYSPAPRRVACCRRTWGTGPASLEVEQAYLHELAPLPRVRAQHAARGEGAARCRGTLRHVEPERREPLLAAAQRELE